MEHRSWNDCPVDDLALTAKAGDRHALERLLQDTNVTRVIYAKIRDQGIRNPADAEEVFQDVRVKIARKIHTWQATGKITTWICTVTIHACLDVLRKPALCTVTLDDPESQHLLV